MKNLLLFLSLSWAVLSACAQAEVLLPQAQQTSIYEEQLDYPSGIGDRCYLIFWKDSLGVHGCLNATTDEFFLVREGYLPGYEIRPLQNIIVKQDSLSFTVEAGVEFDYPVPLYCKEEATAQRMGIPRWIQKGAKPDVTTRIYKGKIEANRLVIDEGEPYSIPRKRVFIRCN
ncbi:hypothetical protein [Alloprevotella sp. oral taxon 473]|uniref:hypothetical protein n=1 Tax=Alloprevotella sp. oral taxon 473 TaxID=712469 RepID=UPI0002A437B4|nr:hypothetical protein [Alloprevotella sp. oral taxon 473]EKX93582.1 hypothetical protein HMPREF9999_00292 [Alloprevotella sp. oral taxon 473 str. F0040]